MFTNDNILRFAVFYRPPSNDVSAEIYMNDMCRCIRQFQNVNYPVTILGDVNCPHIDWSNNIMLQTSPVQQLLLELSTELALHQLISSATRDQNLLDVLLCNDLLSILDLSVNVPFSTSDHSVIDFKIFVGTFIKCESVSSMSRILDVFNPVLFYDFPLFNWQKADWLSIENYY